LDNAVERWKSDLKREDVYIVTLQKGEQVLIFLTTVLYEKDYIYGSQLQVNYQYVQQREVPIYYDMLLLFLKSEFQNRSIYGIVMPSNVQSRQIYEKYGAYDSVWLPDAHPYAPKEEGWVGVIYPTPTVRDMKVYSVFILFQKLDNDDIGIGKDVDNVVNFFRREEFTDIHISKAPINTMKAEDFDNQLKKLVEKGIKKIFVYYTGYGKNDGYSDYPTLSTTTKEKISLLDLHNAVVKYPFEASIVGADCTNILPKCSTTESTNDSIGESAQFKCEFVHPFSFSGHLIFSSAKKGQHAFGNEEIGGSRFTRTFFGTSIESGTFFGHWKSGLDEAIKQLRENEQSPKIEDHQEPFYTEVNFQQAMTLFQETSNKYKLGGSN
jgi:hypothetical protein